MTIRASKFTPEVLLSAPRRSAGLPNSDGSRILYSVSTYSFSEHSRTSEIRVLHVESQQTSLITDDATAGDFQWLDDVAIAVLFSGDDGVTTMKIGRVDYGWNESSYTVGCFDGPVSGIKLHNIGFEDYVFAIVGKATPSGDLFNPSKASKPHTTGRLYKSMFVRHWDHYITENRNSIFLGKLSRKKGSTYRISNFRNALKDTGLESPIEPFGGGDHFDITRNRLVFTAKDPDLNPALHTKTNIYLHTWNDDASTTTKVEIYGFEGASTSPVFSPDGNSLAFLAMKTDGYEADKNQVFVVLDIRRPSWVVHAFPSKDGKGAWDRSPQSIIWSPEGVHGPVYFVAEDHGRGCLFESNFTQTGLSFPEMIVKGGAIGDVQVLENGDLFISSTSLIDNSLYSLLPVAARDRVYSLPDGITTTDLTTRYISSLTKNGGKFNLTRRQIDEVHWPGAAKGTSVHAWVVKPSTFSSKKKYPLAYLIHGGPQGAWEDAWSTRWNPAIFAEQGYVVVAPNPTGSTGYGQDFVDAIQGQWGGLPYEDLVKGFDWIRENLEYVDTERAVALGASYGGYMMNWIQGHPLGRHFRALVTHDGVFSMTSQMASEELYFPFHDMKGPLWKNPGNWAQWDPSRFTSNWSTPHLVIHSELDYRLTISEGLAAFHTLQSRGVESQFLTFPDENHWVLKPENSLLWHEVVLDWINGHVGLEKYSESRRKIVEGAKEEEMLKA